MRKKGSSVKGTIVENSFELFGEPYRKRTTGKMRHYVCHECGNSRYGQVRYYSQKNMTNAICPKCFNEMCSNVLRKTEPDNNLRQGSTIYLWQDNHKCKATSRILKKSNYMLDLGSFGTPVISMYRCSGCGKKFMPQDTYDKNTIVDQYYVVVSANGEILNDRFADSFAVNRQEKKIPVKVKKPQTIVRKKPFNNKVIETTGFLTRTTIKRCSAENHTIEDIKVVVRVLNREYEVTSEIVPAVYCRTCNKYYLLESDYKSLLKKGIILCNVVEESYWTSPSKKGFYITNNESLLHKMGYNVSANSNMYKNERRAILKAAIECKLMTKAEVLSHLDYLIARSRKRDNLADAVEKWEGDRQYVQDLTTDKNTGVYNPKVIVHRVLK